MHFFIDNLLAVMEPPPYALQRISFSNILTNRLSSRQFALSSRRFFTAELEKFVRLQRRRDYGYYFSLVHLFVA